MVVLRGRSPNCEGRRGSCSIHQWPALQWVKIMQTVLWILTLSASSMSKKDCILCHNLPPFIGLPPFQCIVQLYLQVKLLDSLLIAVELFSNGGCKVFISVSRICVRSRPVRMAERVFESIVAVFRASSSSTDHIGSRYCCVFLSAAMRLASRIFLSSRSTCSCQLSRNVRWSPLSKIAFFL